MYALIGKYLFHRKLYIGVFPFFFLQTCIKSYTYNYNFSKACFLQSGKTDSNQWNTSNNIKHIFSKSMNLRIISSLNQKLEKKSYYKYIPWKSFQHGKLSWNLMFWYNENRYPYKNRKIRISI